MKTKLYPFSVQKHAHDIDYYRYFLMNRIYTPEEYGLTAEQVAKYEDRLEDVNAVLTAIMSTSDGKVAWLTGKQYGLAHEITFWAGEARSNAKYSG